MLNLKLYKEFNRKEVHEIFAPDTTFTPQAGTWGLQGIVSIPDRPGDFVFFVTYGQSQADHEFDESITESGVLSWQSQPSQDLSNKVIKQLILHDETVNSIYLFLRTKKDRSYSYLGRLKYITHDSQREKPVYFQWQILDWDIQSDDLSRIGLNLVNQSKQHHKSNKENHNLLIETKSPDKREIKDGVSTEQFKSIKQTDYASRDLKNRRLGLAGEELVVSHEKTILINAGRKDLADKVRHVAKEEGDGAGYDILSFKENGDKKYIEVKTTQGGRNSQFYVSMNEVNFSEKHPDFYHLYRLYNYDEATNTSDFFVLEGVLSKLVKLTPTNFKASFEI
ncbi:MAG: DUF3427 domain-containing protein [Methylotenera sp.]|nr:DUF3427 domain-containing protein [Methylotenera sp.]MDP2404581.1 DUF3427 domain-containing protein [Methylotenera sp.]MDP3094375.1 DUF3427 domain-containing protein [Methylotenera sp.]MDZ4222193.1 DUF3427 domain-containing protein [Methylotenera sp.]